MTGEQQHFAFGMDGFELDTKVNTVELGHHHISNEQVGRPGFSRKQGVEWVYKGNGFKPAVLKDFRQCCCNQMLVVHYVDQRGHDCTSLLSGVIIWQWALRRVHIETAQIEDIRCG